MARVLNGANEPGLTIDTVDRPTMARSLTVDGDQTRAGAADNQAGVPHRHRPRW